MTRKYNYQGKQLTAKELVALSDNVGYDAIKTPLRNRPGKATKIDLLGSIPKADTFNGLELTKHDKIIITGLIADYLKQKERGMELLQQ